MVKDKQVKGLMEMLSSGMPLKTAAMKCDLCEDTARKYRDIGRYPSQLRTPRKYRTRQDPFDAVWSTEVVPLLETHPGLEAKTIFGDLKERYPDRFSEGQLRTLQRRLHDWRALYGKSKETFFPQDHYPGRLCESDFTHMSSLGITIQGRPFDHLVYHFVLTYSNWEDGTVCFTESMESLSEGLQNALWKLGGAPQRHRNDCLTAAVNNLKDTREFTARHVAVLNHYGMEGEHTNPNSGNENGDVEQRHYRFKRAVDQALMVRGSRDFGSREEYEVWLSNLFAKLNAVRTTRLAEELPHLRKLPAVRLPVYLEIRDLLVSNASTVRIRRNVYSVHSRLIGEHVNAHLHSNHIDIYYDRTFVEQLPRLTGKGNHAIDYRHVIDWLVRKPGAFAQYRYRSDLFPSSTFRIAYDMLKANDTRNADKEYLKILYCAARESEDLTQRALEQLIASGNLVGHAEVERLVRWYQQQSSAPPKTGCVEDVELSQYDALLTEKEAAQ